MIKPRTLVANYQMISQADDAVDKDAPDFDEKWRLYLDGMGECPLRPGVAPTIIRLRHLRESERSELLPLIFKSQRDPDLFPKAAYLACALGLVGVDNWEGGKVERVISDGIEMVSDECMNKLGGVIYEIGMRVIQSLSVDPK